MKDGAQRDSRVMTYVETIINEDGQRTLALANDLGIRAKVLVSSFGDIASRAFPALPPEAPPSMADLSATKVKRTCDGHRKPVLPGCEEWEFLHCLLPSAPVATPSALDPSNPDSPLFFRRTPPAAPYAPDAIEGRVLTASDHPGPFFALPGDSITAFALCTALPTNSLGLAPGLHVQHVEVNTSTGLFRVLGASGWSFGTVVPDKMGRYIAAMGARCADCEGPEGPEGWRRPASKKAIDEERDRRFGVKACGQKYGSNQYVPYPLK
ncbi:hypothetical protein DFJ74DRAFT_27047 [Hyaloraphidium curvatum]|nr:hypothetical protein DFJ74DRAFT_714765 [Hyaloraphidium curvatum]KAI9026034.1 hypothetical protein DFJ74DRAFT_27047 [Hyaloraphidium curvatum]